MSRLGGTAAPIPPTSRVTAAQPVSPTPTRPTLPPMEFGVINSTEDRSAYNTALEGYPVMMEAPSVSSWMETPVPSQTYDGVGVLDHQAYAPEDAASAQLLLDAIAPPSRTSVAPFPSKGKRKAVVQDDEEEFLDPALRKSSKRARLNAPSHQRAAFSESNDVEGGEFVVSSAWSSNDLKDWPPAHAWPLSIAFPDYQYNTQVPHDESVAKSGFVNVNTNLKHVFQGSGYKIFEPITEASQHVHTAYNTGYHHTMEAPGSTARNEMAPQHPGDEFAATQGLGGLFTAPDPQYTPNFSNGGVQTGVSHLQHQATGYPTTLQWQPPLTVSTQATVDQQLNAPGSRKKARKAPNTATGRASKARMNTTRLNEDARPPMGVEITAKEIAVFNQKWMVSPDLARRFQRNGITGPMISTTHLEAIGRANNAKDQTTLKNKIKKEYSQGGMYALKCKKWKVSKATAMGPENVLTANGWKFRDHYRHQNGDTKDAPKQGWNDYPLSLFYSHIPTDKWPTGQDRGIMTRVFEFCKKHGRTEATTADWNAIIEEMPAEPKIVPRNGSKNLDQEAAEAFSRRKQPASSQDDS